MVAQEDLWLCRDELTGVDTRIEGWDIRGHWFGVVVGTTPRTGDLRRGETMPWRVIECANSALAVTYRADLTLVLAHATAQVSEIVGSTGFESVTFSVSRKTTGILAWLFVHVSTN
jgi:hypothetical protein